MCMSSPLITPQHSRAGTEGDISYALWDWLLHQVPAFVGLGLIPTADSPDPVPPDICPSSYVNVSFLLKPWMGGGLFHLNLPPQLTAAAGNYAHVNLRISAGETLPWRPRTSSSPMCTTYLALSVHVDLASGTLESLGRGSKFLSSPLGSPTDILHFFTMPRPAST
jgi:hypothetical protein